jgi:hypothetical protein
MKTTIIRLQQFNGDLRLTMLSHLILGKEIDNKMKQALFNGEVRLICNKDRGEGKTKE